MSRIVIALCLTIPFAGISPAQETRSAAEAEHPIASTLAIQEAMRQGRDLMQKGRTREAVDVLESQLPRINGNTSYLALLREAYYALIKELQLAHQDEQCETYLKRLQVLDKNAKAVSTPTPPRLQEPSTPRRPPSEPIARGARGEDDPFQQAPRRSSLADRSLLPAAEKAFGSQQYAEAETLFRQAFGEDTAPAPYAAQWAYCKMHAVVNRMKAAGGKRPETLEENERELAWALRMVENDPKLKTFGEQLLAAVRAQRSAAPADLAIRHLERGKDGWNRAESANFRIVHNQPRDFVEQVLQAAEEARAAAFEKWSGKVPESWAQRCEMYLYATANEYSRATGKPVDSPGHATYQSQNKKVVGRRLDLRADEPNLLACVVPHEITHIVLGDLFADLPLPRWADEGMSVLAEPRARIDRFARTLSTCRRQGKLISLAQLLARDDYPDANLITVFYVESVSIVDFLVNERGAQAFVKFVRDSSVLGLEPALKRHYQIASVAELQNRWLIRTFAESDGRTAVSASQH